MALAWVAATVITGCSLATVDRSKCTADSECEQAFGAGAACGADGFCQPAAPAEVDAAAPDDDGPSLVLAGSCESELPEVSLADDATASIFTLDTGATGNDIDAVSCLDGVSLPGNEGFFSVYMAAGEKWHFFVHVPPDAEAADPVPYVLRSCDPQSCQPGYAADDCGPGGDEHFSFVPPDAGYYLIGVDSGTAGGAALDLTVVRPICGNGKREHSESCDDGNQEDGDGCDAVCRTELTTGAAGEAESNGDYTAANLVIPDADTGALTVSGALSGGCDVDMFALQVPEGGAIEAEVLTASGEPCGTDIPAVGLALLGVDAVTPVGEGSPRNGNACPSIDASDSFAGSLGAGTYFLRLRTNKDSTMSLDYQLRLLIQAPAAVTAAE